MEPFNSSQQKKDSKPAPPKAQGQKLAKEFIGLFFLLLGALIILSLITYASTDPTLNKALAKNAVIQNKAGLFGAYLAGLLVEFFGIGSYVWALLFFGLGGGFLTKWLLVAWWRFLGYILLGVSLISLAAAWDISIFTIQGGGLCGNFLYKKGLLYFSPMGSGFVWLFILLLSTQLIFGIMWLSLLKKWFTDFGSSLQKSFTRQTQNFSFNEKKENKDFKEKNKEKKNLFSFFSSLKPKKKESTPIAPLNIDRPFNFGNEEKNSFSFSKKEKNLEEEFNSALAKKTSTDKPNFSFTNNDEEEILLETSQILPPTEPDKWSFFGKKKKADSEFKEQNSILPNPKLLSPSHEKEVRPSQDILDEKASVLLTALSNFAIQAELVRTTPGPVVTMFEIRPAAGIKVSKISSLADDLAMSLKAMAVRIQAPIPGSDTVGIEIPNDERATVSFAELVQGSAFQSSPSFLTMALGKNISGAPVAADLAKMPHLLVAGATGTGKSVCLNSILLSFLFKAKPSEVKLLLIDPKRIELAAYEDLPHLVHPVVTEMNLAKNALLWAVDEMDRRYKLLRDMAVRNIAAYNEKVKNLPPQANENTHFEENIHHEFLPYLVIIIDELADLMLTHGKDVETSIVRLAQLARAAGIHIILATQRPSVDVVTGLIKANFPCRISFQVTSKHDSRTILDTVGAEHLLGKGDMLFKPSGGKLQRLHGAFMPDDDVANIVDYWKKQQKPDYSAVDFSIYNNESTLPNDLSQSDLNSDPDYIKACELIPTLEKVTISGLQRRLRIGFNKAARYVEQMEKDGIIQNKDK